MRQRTAGRRCAGCGSIRSASPHRCHRPRLASLSPIQCKASRCKDARNKLLAPTMAQAIRSDANNTSTADTRHGAQTGHGHPPSRKPVTNLLFYRMVKAGGDLPRNDEFTSYHKPKTTHTTTHEDTTYQAEAQDQTGHRRHSPRRRIKAWCRRLPSSITPRVWQSRLQERAS